MLYLIFIIIIGLYFFRNKAIPSILYHQICEYSNVDVELFEDHLKYLKKKNYKTITISEYYSGDYNKKDKLVILTFDDGYYDNYKNMYPILKKYNMKATIFLNTFYIKDEIRKNETNIKSSAIANEEAVNNYIDTGDATTWQYMTWEEIKEMHKSGMIDFQAHSHKHTPIFTSKNIEGFYKEKSHDSSNIYSYGRDVKEGDPIFKKRGECSQKGYIIKKEFFNIFNEFYHKELKNIDEKEKLKKAQQFIDSNIDIFIFKESEKEAKKRISEEGLLNKKIIEKKLSKDIIAFCWPWGHKSKLGIEALKEVGYRCFVTTTKGTNSVWGNKNKIRRVELRNFTLRKFILNILINRNLLLGRIYELIS